MSKYKTIISTSDLTSYIRIKGEEDYTYNDMVTTLNNENYEDMPNTFLLFMGRAIEDTIISLYPKRNSEDLGEVEDMYIVTGETSHELHVRYMIRGQLFVVGYKINEILKALDRDKLEKFLEEYMDRISIKLVDLEEEKGKDGDYRLGVKLIDDLFQTVAKINLYINKVLEEEKGNKVTMVSRIEEFMETYTWEINNRGNGSTIRNRVNNWISSNYKGYDFT